MKPPSRRLTKDEILIKAARQSARRAVDAIVDPIVECAHRWPSLEWTDKVSTEIDATERRHLYMRWQTEEGRPAAMRAEMTLDAKADEIAHTKREMARVALLNHETKKRLER